MGEWVLPCDCCKKTIKKIKNEIGTYESYNVDDTPHEKHFKIWASSVASFSQYPTMFERIDPKSKVGDLTVEQLDQQLEYKLNFKFGQYFHGQSGYEEIWLTPKKFSHLNIDYFVAGNIDGDDSGRLIELKTTWFTSKYKIQSVIDKAQTQADIYAWIGNFKEAKIIVKNLAKPSLSIETFYRPQPEQVEELLVTYIEENRSLIKKY